MGEVEPRPTVPIADAKVFVALTLLIDCRACKARAAGSTNLVGCTTWVRAGTPPDLNNWGTGALDTRSSIGLCKYGVAPKLDCDMYSLPGSLDIGEASLVEQFAQELCIDDRRELTSIERPRLPLKDGFLESLLLLDLLRLLASATHGEPLADRSGEDLFL